jgi:hypothetical protein
MKDYIVVINATVRYEPGDTLVFKVQAESAKAAWDKVSESNHERLSRFDGYGVHAVFECAGESLFGFGDILSVE